MPSAVQTSRSLLDSSMAGVDLVGERSLSDGSPHHIFTLGSYICAKCTEGRPTIMHDWARPSRDPLFALITRHTHAGRRLSGSALPQTCMGRVSRRSLTSTRTSENIMWDDRHPTETAQVEPSLGQCRSPWRLRHALRWRRWPGSAPPQPIVGVSGRTGD